MSTNKRPVETNLIQQNCFIKIANHSVDEMLPYCHTQYFELQRKVVENGIVEELVAVDYPINPQSVKSYADSADYHRDPAGAVANSTAKTNLGDITEVQKAATLDTETAKAIYAKVLEDVTKTLAEQSKTEQSKTTEEVTPNE